MLLANADRLVKNLISVDFRYLCQSCFLSLCTQPTIELFWSQMKGMAKIRLFYTGIIALILPLLKDITHFVFMYFMFYVYGC